MRPFKSAVLLALGALFVWAAPGLAQGAKNIIRGDFLANSDTVSWAGVRNARSAADRNGNYVVVWEDDCNGDLDIYARRFNASGTALGPSFRVNDDPTNLAQTDPCVAMNWSGKFVIAWEDQRDLLENIYYQYYDAAGAALGANRLGNSDAMDWLSQKAPAAAMNGSGGFVLAWEDDQAGYRGIYAQRFDSTGAKLGFEFHVDDNPDYEWLMQPSAGMDLAGNFIVAWSDRRDANRNIYAKRYNSSGTQLSTDFQVNSELLNDQITPQVGMCESGSFAVAWQDNRDGGHYDIFARLFNSSGTPQGVDFQVNSETGTSHQEQSVAFDSTGKFLITWVYGTTQDTYLRRYSSTGAALGAQILVAHGILNATTSQPTAAMGRLGNFNLVFDAGWEDFHIRAQRYDSSAAAQGSIYSIDDNMGHSFQITPAVAMDRNGRFAVAWSDSFNAHREASVYFQQLDAAGSQVGGNIMPYTSSIDQSYPALAAGGGVTTVFWSQNRNTGYRVMARRYDDSGTPLAAAQIVSDTIPTGNKKKQAVAICGNGRVAAAWEDGRDYPASDTFNVYFQLIDSSGTLLGANQKVNDDATLKHQLNPAMAASHAGNFFLVWQDDRSGNYDIYAQRYDASGTAVGSNFKVNDNAGTSSQTMPSVACDSAGNVVVAWQDQRSSSYDDIYAQRYDASGAAVGANFKVNDDIGSAYQYSPAVASAPTAGRFVICWTDFRNGDGDPEIMAQSYQGGSASGANFQVTDDDNFSYHHQTTNRWNIAANDDRVAFAWTDNRRHKGYDVYSKLTDWNFNNIVVQLPTPVLLTPADNSWQATGTFHCSWSASKKKDAPVYYVVKAYQLPDTLSPVLVDTTSLTADTLVLSAEARYAWRVEARDDGGGLPGISALRFFGIDHTAPDIQYVLDLPDDVSSPYGPYQVSSKVYDLSGVKSAWLFRQVNGGAWDSTQMFSATDSLYDSIPALSPAMDETLTVSYYVKASDQLDQTSTSATLSFKAIDLTGVEGNPLSPVPAVFALNGAWPNPSRGQTTFKYQLPKESSVSLTVYNIAGQMVKRFDQGTKPAGYHQIGWNASALPNGIYFYRLQAGSFSATRKLLMVR